MNFYKKITITIFSILIVFGFSVGFSLAFVGPDVGQSPGTGGGLLDVDSNRNIGFGTENPSIGTNAEGSSWGYTFTVASSSNPGLSLLNTSASGRQYSFYSHDSGSFGLFDGTAGQVRLRVTSSGDIGVGSTNAPQSLFHVFGTSQATSFTGSGINLTNIDPQNFIAGSSFNSGNYAVDGSLAIGTSTVTSAPSNGLYVDGSVGIGIYSPSRKLDVNGIIRAGNTGGTGGTGRFEAIGGSSGEAVLTLGDSSNPNAGVIRYRNSDDSIALDTNDSEKVRITSAGNVGIGTTTPSEKLHVEGGHVKFSEGSGNDSRILIQPKASVSDLNPGGPSNSGTIISGPYANHLVFDLTANDSGDSIGFRTDSNTDGTVDTVAMSIKPSGNVGIGTTTSPSKLTVNGTIETTSGGVKFPDGTTQTTAGGGGGGGGDAVGWDRDDNNGYVTLSTSTDRVGIGDSTPSVKLDVNGSTYSSTYYDKDNDSYYVNPSGTSNVSQIDVNSTLNVLGNSYYKGGSNTNLYIRQATSSSNGLIWWEDGQNDSNWYIGSTETNSNWKLGRYNSSGTFIDTPFYVSFGNGEINLNNTIDANSNKIISLATPTSASDAATKSYVDSTAGGGVPSGSDGDTLYNSGGNWVATNNLYNDGANVGVGIQSPSAPFHLNASGNNNPIARFQGGDGGDNAWVDVWSTATSGSSGVRFGDTTDSFQSRIAYNNSSNYIYLENSGSDDLVVDGSGQVGVGDSSPSAKLDVNGSIYGSTIYDKDNTSYYLNPSGGTSASLAGDTGIGTASIDGARYGTGGKTVEVYEGADGEIAQLLVQGSGQGTGYIYVGQSGSHGGGITYNGDDTPNMPHNSDDLSIFRRTGGADIEVLSWAHNSSRAEFRGIVDANGNNVYGATFYDSNNTSYYSNPSGTSNINGLTVNGNWTLSGAAQADVDLSGNDITGVNKITVGTIDPLYKINGQKYATYVPDTIGLKTEIYGKADLQKEFTGKESPKFSHTIDFDQVEEGSDLWLFWKTISLKDDMSDMIVSLTPEGSNADIWYELDYKENQLTIRGDKLATVSYHLVAPRHDSDEWPTKTDTEEDPSFIFEEGKWIK